MTLENLNSIGVFKQLFGANINSFIKKNVGKKEEFNVGTKKLARF